MAKRKMSRKQRVAALKNLAKARRARKRPARASEAPRRRRRAAPRRSRRRARENGFAGFANIKPKRKRSRRGKGRRRTAHLSPAAKKRRAGRRHRTYVRKAYTSKRGVHYPKRRIRRRLVRHHVKGYSYNRKGRTVHVRAHRSYDNPIPYAFENPLTVGEVIVGGLVGVIGYGLSSFVDRLVAAHALKPALDANGQPVPKDPKTGLAYFTDAPGKGELYNRDAVVAPMGLARWAAGAIPPLVLIGGSRWVSNSMGRTTLQFLGFGYLTRTVGKGGTDLMAWLLRKTNLGQRLYAPEIVAHALAKGVKPDAQLPPASALTADQYTALVGFGQLPAVGMGTCCGNCGGATPPVDTRPPPGMMPPLQTPPEPPRQAAPPPPPPRASGDGGRGLPANPPAPTAPPVGAAGLPRSPYNWGNEEAAA